MSSKKGVKKALWNSAGHLSTSPRASVRGKVSTWRGIKKALWDSAGHLSIRVVGGEEEVERGEKEVGVGLKLENGHSSPLMVTTAP